LAIPNQLSN